MHRIEEECRALGNSNEYKCPLEVLEDDGSYAASERSFTSPACFHLNFVKRLPMRKHSQGQRSRPMKLKRGWTTPLVWIKKNVIDRYLLGSSTDIFEENHSGDSLRMYHVQMESRSESDSQLDSVRSKGSCGSRKSSDWYSPRGSPTVKSSKMLKEDSGCIEDAISCSKTDFWHFAKVLDNGQSDSFVTLWGPGHNRLSRSEDLLTSEIWRQNAAKKLSERTVHCSTPDSLFTPTSYDPQDDFQITAKHLIKLIKAGHKGDEIDLRGQKVCGTGNLCISTPGLTLKNGHLDFIGGVSVKAEQVQLMNLKITSSGPQANALGIFASNCKVRDCIISSADGSGVLVDGIRSSATLNKCCIQNCYGNCVWVAKGAQLDCRLSDICKSVRFHGLAAEDRGTTVRLFQCRIHENHQDGIFVTSGAEVFVDACEVWGSKKFHGISVKKKFSHVRVNHSKIYDNMQTCASVGDGGKLDMYVCEVWGAVSYGLLCDGEGSVIQLAKSHIFDSNLDTVRVTNCATLNADESSFHGSKLANGIAILSGSQCILKASDISCSALSGIWVSGSSSMGNFRSTQIRDNEVCNLFVDGSAWANLADCKMYGAKRGSAVAVKGMGSQVRVSTSIVHSNPVGNYTALLWARLCIDGMECKGTRPRHAPWIRYLSSKN